MRSDYVYQHVLDEAQSCTCQLNSSYSLDTYSFLNSESAVDAIHLDFRKAFDTDSTTQTLTDKARRLRSNREILGVAQYFSDDEKQKVVINREGASWEDITIGMPWGSVLVPVLFVSIICINDLKEVVR